MTSAPTRIRPARSRLGIAVVVLGYALPLAVAATLLFLLGDQVLGVALLLTEAVVFTGVQLALRRPEPRREREPGEPKLGWPDERPRGTTGSGFLRVGAGMAAIMILIVVLAVVASHSG